MRQYPTDRIPGLGAPPAFNEAAWAASQALRAHISAEIDAAGGWIPFDCFMDLALYAPGLGYYVAGAPKFGPEGDFVTAPELSPLFARCLAVQCAEILQQLGTGDILELGPGSGALAAELLTALEQAGQLPDRYWFLEPSPELQQRQHQRLTEQVPQLLDRCHWLSRLPASLQGVVLANEVLDAMPVHRFQIAADGQAQEIGVAREDERLYELAGPICSPGLAEALAVLQAAGYARAPGYASEINLRLGPWVAALAQTLVKGVILAIDYGYPRSGYYQADRHMGTLMCHFRHQPHEDPFANLGLQDITAHVDFSAVAAAGEAAGLSLAGFTTQAHFLIGCGIERYLAAEDTDLASRLAAKQLLLPTAMGERFKVMALATGQAMAADWCGFAVRDLRDRL